MTEEELSAALSDPNVVHVNMLRGTIARPTPAQIIHIYGTDAIRAALPKDDWRLIETAPREIEFRCLLGHEFSVVTGYWDGKRWVNERSARGDAFSPTHWMPIPDAPPAPSGRE